MTYPYMILIIMSSGCWSIYLDLLNLLAINFIPKEHHDPCYKSGNFFYHFSLDHHANRRKGLDTVEVNMINNISQLHEYLINSQEMWDLRNKVIILYLFLALHMQP